MRNYLPLSVLFCLANLLSSIAWSHPDLLLQIEQLSAQLNQDPGNATLLLKRGDLYRRHEDWEKSLFDFRRAREMNPGNPQVDWFEGRLFIQWGDPQQGLDLLNKFLNTHAEHSIALQNRAQAYLLLHRPLEAARDYGKVIRVSPRPTPVLYSARALALVQAGSDQYTHAMTTVVEGLNKFPQEITLTGIGVDISLAESDTQMVDKMFAQLPGPIRQLYQWQTRQALLECQKGSIAEARQWFSMAATNQSRYRSLPGTLTRDQLSHLASAPTVELCQQVSLQMLKRYQE